MSNDYKQKGEHYSNFTRQWTSSSVLSPTDASVGLEREVGILTKSACVFMCDFFPLEEGKLTKSRHTFDAR